MTLADASELVVADLGNSRLKWGRVERNGALGLTCALPVDDPSTWATAWAEWGLEGSRWAVSSVNPPVAERLRTFLGDRGVEVVRWFRSAADVPIKHALDQSETAGADRALAVLGAVALSESGRPGLVVSCGSALVVERIAADGTWHGGAIAPGLTLSARALHLLTAQLPSVEPCVAPPPWGGSTRPAIEAGIYWGVVGAVRELVTRQTADLTPLPWLIWTGGDAPVLAPRSDGPTRGSFPTWCSMAWLGPPRKWVDRMGNDLGAQLAVLTAEGRGAVSVVRVWGRSALAVADAAFRPARGEGLAQSPRERPRLGRFGAGRGDEVVAVVLAGDPPEVEVHCHGGPAPRALVIESLVAAGAEVRSWSDWTDHVVGGKIASAAYLDLAHAPTVRSATILVEQANGALETEVRRLQAQIQADPSAAHATLATLIRRSEVGLRLVLGWRVALAGRPNVGKSRLLNALAGYERAIVAPTPGTTRDVVTVRTAFDGWPVELADTAGLRDSIDPIEASGVALARTYHGEADLVLMVLDRSEPLTEADLELIGMHESSRVLRVANKSDLPAAWESSEFERLTDELRTSQVPTPPSPPLVRGGERERLPNSPPYQGGVGGGRDSGSDVSATPAQTAITISAERGDGIEALVQAIARRLVPDPPPPGAGLPFRPEHVVKLTEALAALEAGATVAAARSLEALL